MVPQDPPIRSAVRRKQLLVELERTVRRALVARNGLDVGSDAASEAMAWAVQHLDRVSTMSNPAGYLYRVGQTAARRQRRWTRRQPSLGFEPLTDDTAVDFDGALFDALARLKRDQRVAVVLVHSYDYSYSEVADVLEISEAAVTNHVHRGLARLRSVLGAR